MLTSRDLELQTQAQIRAELENLGVSPRTIQQYFEEGETP